MLLCPSSLYFPITSSQYYHYIYQSYMLFLVFRRALVFWRAQFFSGAGRTSAKIFLVIYFDSNCLKLIEINVHKYLMMWLDFFIVYFWCVSDILNSFSAHFEGGFIDLSCCCQCCCWMSSLYQETWTALRNWLIITTFDLFYIRKWKYTGFLN